MLKSQIWENYVLASTHLSPGLSLTHCLCSTCLPSLHQLPNRTPSSLQLSDKSFFFVSRNMLHRASCVYYWLKLATYPQMGGNATQNSQGKTVLPQSSSQLPVEPVVHTPTLLARCPLCCLHRRGLKGHVLGCKDTFFFQTVDTGLQGLNKEK